MTFKNLIYLTLFDINDAFVYYNIFYTNNDTFPSEYRYNNCISSEYFVKSMKMNDNLLNRKILSFSIVPRINRSCIEYRNNAFRDENSVPIAHRINVLLDKKCEKEENINTLTIDDVISVYSYKYEEMSNFSVICYKKTKDDTILIPYDGKITNKKYTLNSDNFNSNKYIVTNISTLPKLLYNKNNIQFHPDYGFYNKTIKGIEASTKRKIDIAEYIGPRLSLFVTEKQI